MNFGAGWPVCFPFPFSVLPCPEKKSENRARGENVFCRFTFTFSPLPCRSASAEWNGMNESINLKSKQNSTINSINHKAILWAMWITHLANTWSNHTTMTAIPILVYEHTAPGAVRFLLLVSHNYNYEIVSFFPSPPICWKHNLYDAQFLRCL